MIFFVILFACAGLASTGATDEWNPSGSGSFADGCVAKDEVAHLQTDKRTRVKEDRPRIRARRGRHRYYGHRIIKKPEEEEEVPTERFVFLGGMLDSYSR